MKDLAPHDVVTWLREQAKTFGNMADTIERTFRIASPKMTPNGSLAGSAKAMPSIPQIKHAVSGRAFRPASLAEELNVPVADLLAVLTEENGFSKGDRGWMTLKEDSP